MNKKIPDAFFGMTHFDNLHRLTDLITMAEMKAIVKLAWRAAGHASCVVGCNADDMADACGTKIKPMSPKTMSNMITKFKRLNIMQKHKGLFRLNPTILYSGRDWEIRKREWVRLFDTMVINGEKGTSEHE